MQLIRSLHQALQLTVVMVTHDLDTLFALSTRVAVLADKQVIASGTPSDILDVPHPFITQFFLGERGRHALLGWQAANRNRDLNMEKNHGK